VVLAAGRGTRLGSLARDLPKPLLPVAGSPILIQNLELLARSGVTDVAINLHHQGEAIRGAIGDGTSLGLTVRYSEEAELLGTAGGVRQAASLLPSTWPLLVVYGDNLLRFTIARMLESHRSHNAAATIAVHRIADVRGSGTIAFDEAGRVTQFIEKPPLEEAQSGWVNAGVYLLEPAVADAIPSSEPSDFGYDVFPRLLADGLGLFVHQLIGSEAVYGVDTPDRYRATLELFAQ
jgi:NDP-sugar pyrophosphorylase family protein